MNKNMRVLIVCKHSANSSEAKVCRLMSSGGFDVRYSWKNTLKIVDLKDIDLVVSIGGDGTALSASHFLFERPLLAVNSSPKNSEGALTTTTIENLSNKLKKIILGKHRLERLERIDVYINGKEKKPVCLNEVFIANKKAYLSSKYSLIHKRGGKKIEETQLSSGVLFSTGTGSTAWYKSAGGKPYSPQSRYVKMLVREPYIGKLHKFSMFSKTIFEGDEMIVKPLTNMVLAIDSIREFNLKAGDKVKIKTSKYPLLRII